jgi:hypothetical protein
MFYADWKADDPAVVGTYCNKAIAELLDWYYML